MSRTELPASAGTSGGNGMPGPGRRERVRLRLVAAVLAVAVAVAALLVAFAHGAGPFARPGGNAQGADLPPAQAFLATYVGADGRVVRRDQGGDTVSEGQGYAMLLAAAQGDRARFAAVWDWTRTHLRRPDGLLSWSWASGRVRDPESAADGDLDVAHALVLAGARFGEGTWRSDGVALGRAVLDHESVVTPLGRVLTAGSWVTTAPYRVNPSYASPAAFAALGSASGDRRWTQLAAGSRTLVAALLDKAPLPPDWAQVGRDGAAAAMPAPDGGPVRFGLDAARVPVRFGASCDPDDVALVARLAPALVHPADQVRGVSDLGGAPTVGWSQPVALLAAASAASASGQAAPAASLRAAATDLARRVPTYYGDAWAALAPTTYAGTGCAGGGASASSSLSASASGSASASASASDPGASVEPAAVEIPRIGVRSALVHLSLDAAGVLVPPAAYARAGWLSSGPAPGDTGPAVIGGHVDSRTGPAVFARLSQLRPGDEVVVRRTDGRRLTFTVDEVRRVAKDAFPTAEVYGPTPAPVLRLLTCGGSFDGASGHYRDNVVVFASLRS